MTLPFDQDLSLCFAERIGEGGLSRTAFEDALAGCAEAVADLRYYRDSGSLPLLNLPEAKRDLETLEPIAKRFAERFERVLVLGTGGSTLGGQTLVELAQSPFAPRAGRPWVHFLDNVDPDRFDELYRAADLARTGVIVISKSGGTAETLTQLLTLLPKLQAAVGEAGLQEHLLVITEPYDNALRRLSDQLRVSALVHDPKVGGRFSVLSVVGALPALIAGVDMAAARQGALAVLEDTLAEDGSGGAAAQGAALATAAEAAGRTISVMMPYADRLASFGLWYCQLWAESLGKQSKGTTPVRAVGTVDQHSQLQLYLDGPPDKLFTVVTADRVGTGASVETELARSAGLDYLAERTMGDLIDAEQRATIETLARRGCPVRRLHAPRVDEATVGALLMHFMLETMLTARLWDVNAFDQPAVEDGKVLTRTYLGEMAGAAKDAG